MATVRTHYDNLKVSKDAPIEIIEAAFHALAAKYSAGLRAGDPEAARIAMIVSRSYAVLSDPAQRAEHDKWIVDAEEKAAAFAQSQKRPRSTPGQQIQNEVPPIIQREWFQVGLGVVILCFVIGLFTVFGDHKPATSSNVPAAVATIPPKATAPPVAEVAIPLPIAKATRTAVAAPPLPGPTRSARSEIDDVIQSGKYFQLPPADVVTEATGSGPSHLSLVNSTIYTLTVTFDGPLERSVKIAVGGSLDLELPPGAYRVLCRASNPLVVPFVGDDDYFAGGQYKSTFVLRHRPIR